MKTLTYHYPHIEVVRYSEQKAIDPVTGSIGLWITDNSSKGPMETVVVVYVSREQVEMILAQFNETL